MSKGYAAIMQLIFKMDIVNQKYVHLESLSIMKTKTKSKKGFDAVKFMRQQRDKLSKKLSEMTREEILEYFRKKNDNASDIKPCAQFLPN